MINNKLPKLWHGADYNPDQWLDCPDVLKADIEYMKKAKCNVMSIGIFSWSILEPVEGVFNFEWLDGVIDSLYENGIYTILATPSGARPPWLGINYPEVNRMDGAGNRYEYNFRHNHCYSSPVYREKVHIIDEKLAERYAHHPGVIMWHISNEMDTNAPYDCLCPLCRENFRAWLKKTYKDIDTLNKFWWNGFWSHKYSDFSQIQPPNLQGEEHSVGLKLAWKRFKSDLLVDFYREEVKTVKKYNPDLPVTTNIMNTFEIDYYKLCKHVDIVSWDNYPNWYSKNDNCEIAVETAFYHSLYNAMKPDKPFMMMESSPSATNWQPAAKLRPCGFHLMSSMQAVAHGSNTVQFFQWRKSRGQLEQFHGAAIGHDGTDKTRIFHEVENVGKALEQLVQIQDTLSHNDVAFLFDYDCAWTLDIIEGFRNFEKRKGFETALFKNLGALWHLNAGVDIIGTEDIVSGGIALGRYKVVVAPMMYILRRGLVDKIEEFVQDGGVFVSTYCTGIVDEENLCWQGKDYYPLGNVLGILYEETDALYDIHENTVEMFGKEYRATRYCELSHLNGAEALGTYKTDFYAGMPAFTVNHFGNGKAYYIAAELEEDGLIKAYGEALKPVLPKERIPDTPRGVNVQWRYGTDGEAYAFVINYTETPQNISLPYDFDILYGDLTCGTIDKYGVCVLKLR